MIVADVMTRNVVFVAPDARLEEVLRLMIDRKLSGLPVVEKDGSVVGMITEGDLMRRPEIDTQGEGPGWLETFFLPGSGAYDYMRKHARDASALMSPDVVTIAPDAKLADAVRLMQAHRVKRLPVVKDGRLVGVLARADLIKALAGTLEPVPALSDSEIAARLSAEIAKQGWVPTANIETTVKDGVVDLFGTISDLRQRHALRVLAETAGARSVRDRLVCIEPISGAVLD